MLPNPAGHAATGRMPALSIRFDNRFAMAETGATGPTPAHPGGAGDSPGPGAAKGGRAMSTASGHPGGSHHGGAAAVAPAPAGALGAPRPEGRADRAASAAPEGPCATTLALRAIMREDSRPLRDAAIRRLMAQGVTAEALLDEHIPALARLMGEEWLCDRAGFVEVTVTASRLQALVRDLCQDLRADAAGVVDGPTVLVVALPEEQHTLGPMILACRFRRMGLSTQLSLGRPAGEVLTLLRRRNVDMLAITLGSEASLEACTALINMCRMTLSRVPPLVVGGALALSGEDVQRRTGADHAVCDPAEAVRRCGLWFRVESASPTRLRRG